MTARLKLQDSTTADGGIHSADLSSLISVQPDFLQLLSCWLLIVHGPKIQLFLLFLLNHSWANLRPVSTGFCTVSPVTHYSLILLFFFESCHYRYHFISQGKHCAL